MIEFKEEISFGYHNRTVKNASADATIAIAVNFNTAGERLTKQSVKSQGKMYIAVIPGNLRVNPLRVDRIVEQLNECSATSLNIAGNGIYTLQEKYTQQEIDEYVYDLLKAVIKHPNLKNKIELVRTGGQTGFDEAGAKAGDRLGIPTLILAPKGWTFRNELGIDISDEAQFKARFNNEVSNP